MHQHFLAGEVLFLSGDSSGCAYIIESGQVRLTINDHAFEQYQEIAVLKAGDLLGEMGIIDNSPRSATATALTDCRVTIINQEQISARMKDADPILKSLIDIMLSRLRQAVEIDRSKKSVGKRSIINTMSKGVDKMRLESQLREAFKNNHINIVYQPMMDLNNQYWTGFESLSRWTHIEHGIISPEVFIPLAEETGLIIEMGKKAFETACQSLIEFQKQRDLIHPQRKKMFMSINVSARQLTSQTFLPSIQDIMGRYAVKPAQIKIEITESLVVDYEKVKTGLDQCREMGFALSLDDFGTGYSGFQHLLELDFNTLKIDQAFTRTMFSNQRSLTLIEVVIDMAKRLNMEIVAEGIETAQDNQILSKIGVDYGQGYFYSKPISKADILKQLKSGV